jgi:hypothetical protein
MSLLLSTVGPVEQRQIVCARDNLFAGILRPCKVQAQRSTWLPPPRMGDGFSARLPPVLRFRHWLGSRSGGSSLSGGLFDAILGRQRLAESGQGTLERARRIDRWCL